VSGKLARDKSACRRSQGRGKVLFVLDERKIGGLCRTKTGNSTNVGSAVATKPGSQSFRELLCSESHAAAL